MKTPIPPPKFEHYERVIVRASRYSQDCIDQPGTVIWLDSSSIRAPRLSADWWAYVVHLPALGCWRTFLQSELESQGAYDLESAHLGQRSEISFDVVIDDDNPFSEGAYRLPGELWKVAILSKRAVPEVTWHRSVWRRPTAWEREPDGVVIKVPQGTLLGREEILRLMSQAVGERAWVEVKGPDSMTLR